MTAIRVGHLYPDYLNIYADRGNIAVLNRRAAWRGHEVVVTALGNETLQPEHRRVGRQHDELAATRCQLEAPVESGIE